MQKATRVASQLGCAPPAEVGLRPLKTRRDKPPHHQDYDCANDCSNETSVLACLIPPDCLAEIGCCKSSNNPDHGRPDEPSGLILVPRMKESRDHPRHKPTYDGPNNTHC